MNSFPNVPGYVRWADEEEDEDERTDIGWTLEDLRRRLPTDGDWDRGPALSPPERPRAHSEMVVRSRSLPSSTPLEGYMHVEPGVGALDSTRAAVNSRATTSIRPRRARRRGQNVSKPHEAKADAPAVASPSGVTANGVPLLPSRKVSEPVRSDGVDPEAWNAFAGEISLSAAPAATRVLKRLQLEQKEPSTEDADAPRKKQQKRRGILANMSDHTMHNDESESVKEQAATSEAMIVDDGQNPTESGSGGKAKKLHPAEQRRLAVKQQLQNREWLARVPWSQVRRPDDDLDDLVVEGSRIIAEYNRHKSDWATSGRPVCETCGKVHPPPCLTPEEAEQVIFQRELLKSYRAELMANLASAKAAASSAQSSKTTKSKSKDKATAVTSDQQESSNELGNEGGSSRSKGEATAEASPQQDKSSSQASTKKKKSKSKSPCPKCGTWHSGECWLKDPCGKCGDWHIPSKPCEFTEEMEEAWTGFLSGVRGRSAGFAAGRMFSKQFEETASSGGKKNKGKGKRSASKDDKSEGPSKKR
ncbi:hypothetical protein HBI04_144290 [Parastagonospora nodorum]|nr:hypothetical protein HBH51_101050 [Parastagonospora nodorum]KAH4044743.1 hypothetical protein HBH49_212470 [Parastagonospora nodorum]KAH4116856.1 hypothetical protein HBH47_162320 [Parastagonospora nodorum]KAH4160059.1 hypothetical protein HBH43_181240 [Parastagonospora nodorum]KAH4258477.1 hypothetical protein HBI03_144940 [Parastagonospora nodorum]